MIEVSRKLYRTCLLAALSAAVFNFGCNKKPISAPPATTARTEAPAPRPTITFQANPTSISKGDTTTLSWSTTNATQVAIAPEIGAIATCVALVVDQLSVVVSPLLMLVGLAWGRWWGEERSFRARSDFLGGAGIGFLLQPKLKTAAESAAVSKFCKAFVKPQSFVNPPRGKIPSPSRQESYHWPAKIKR